MEIFPNVPNVPGVPPLIRAPGVDVNPEELLTSDDPSLSGSSAQPQWGLFQSGQPVIVAESVVSFEYKEDYTISTYPVEGGGFQSYDKVQHPFDVRLRFATGGTVADRQAFLASIDAVISGTELYDAVMPENTYMNVNPVHREFRRTSVNGVGLLQVDVWCEEVRQNATAAFSNTKTPSGADSVSDGTQQPTAVAPNVQSQIQQVVVTPLVGS